MITTLAIGWVLLVVGLIIGVVTTVKYFKMFPGQVRERILEDEEE